MLDFCAGDSARFSSAFVLRLVIATNPSLDWCQPNAKRTPVCTCPCHIGRVAIHVVPCCEQRLGTLSAMLLKGMLIRGVLFWLLLIYLLSVRLQRRNSGLPFLGNTFLVC
jgi:hypothetical protein